MVENDFDIVVALANRLDLVPLVELASYKEAGGMKSARR